VAEKLNVEGAAKRLDAVVTNSVTLTVFCEAGWPGIWTVKNPL
jgi:hypothetical protein